jgi:predicted dinucleotide-binding enzyme
LPVAPRPIFVRNATAVSASLSAPDCGLSIVVLVGADVAGSDEQAKVKVLKLGQELGFEPIDVGPLSRARGTEHLAALWVQLAYLQKLGTGFAFKIIKK